MAPETEAQMDPNLAKYFCTFALPATVLRAAAAHEAGDGNAGGADYARGAVRLFVGVQEWPAIIEHCSGSRLPTLEFECETV